MPTTNQPQRNVIRSVARFVGTSAALFWGSVILLHLIFGDDVPLEEGAEIQGVILSVLIFSAVAATIYAWQNEQRGGIALLVIGGLLSLFALLTAGRNHLAAILVSGMPFLVSGTLFVLSTRMTPPNSSY